MSDTITLTGLVSTTPRSMVTNDGLAITSFRLASTQRRFDATQERWVDGETNWYTVTAHGQLAINAATSIKKGDRVLLTGALKIRDWENDEHTGTVIEIEVTSIGHDLSRGVSTFVRMPSTVSRREEAPDAETPQPE